jgi:hypothetical protein
MKSTISVYEPSFVPVFPKRRSGRDVRNASAAASIKAPNERNREFRVGKLQSHFGSANAAHPCKVSPEDRKLVIRWSVAISCLYSAIALLIVGGVLECSAVLQPPTKWALPLNPSSTARRRGHAGVANLITPGGENELGRCDRLCCISHGVGNVLHEHDVSSPPAGNREQHPFHLLWGIGAHPSGAVPSHHSSPG